MGAEPPGQALSLEGIMARKLSYYELLKDPRWQRKRLEVMQECRFTCEECDATDKTLNIHHTYYLKDRDPWDYPYHALRCYCEDCHKKHQDMILEIQKAIGALTIPEKQQVLEVANHLVRTGTPQESNSVNETQVTNGQAKP